MSPAAGTQLWLNPAEMQLPGNGILPHFLRGP